MKPISAPEIPGHLEWLNTDHPIRLQDIRAKIVLLNFWTSSCVTCIQVMSELARLGEKYPELVVIGVHTPKLKEEQALENVRAAIHRYGIDHPVVLDNRRILWNEFRVSDWPSFVLIDPAGNIADEFSGAEVFERLDPEIARLRDRFEDKVMLDPGRLTFHAAGERELEGVLRYPGKITVDSAQNRIFVVDANHHRIVTLSLCGTATDIIGSGTPGHNDGSFSGASFFAPQGVAYDAADDCLYSADTGNHMIRRACFRTETVETLAGNGKIAAFPPASGHGPDISLNSPWDLLLLEDFLYIAMAGAHQIWRMNLYTHGTEPVAGSGKKSMLDGPLHRAEFARPSGIATDGEAIYVADAENSAIRMISRGVVTTLAGQGFADAGDLDGPARLARLQHPMGLQYHDGRLLIADSHNHKIKSCNFDTSIITTIVRTGLRGFRAGAPNLAQLDELGELAPPRAPPQTRPSAAPRTRPTRSANRSAPSRPGSPSPTAADKAHRSRSRSSTSRAGPPSDMARANPSSPA